MISTEIMFQCNILYISGFLCSTYSKFRHSLWTFFYLNCCLLNFLGLTGGSAVHKPSESSSSARPQGLSKAGSSRSVKGGSKLDTRPSGSHRSKEKDLGNKKSEMKISSKKASSASQRYFIFATFFLAFLAPYNFTSFLLHFCDFFHG